MRVRDIINASLDRIIKVGLLPPDPQVGLPYDGETAGRPRPGGIFDIPAMETAKRIGPTPFAGDTESWRHAFEFVDQFTANSAARTNTKNWPLPRSIGPLGHTAGELYDELCYYFDQAGLRQVTPPNKLHKASFEAIEKLKVKNLPSFYGLYLLEHKKQKNPWDREIELRLRVDLAIEQRARDTVASLAATAPAVSALAAVDDELAVFGSGPRPITRASGRLLLDLAARWGRPAPII